MEKEKKYAIISISDYKGGELTGVDGRYTKEEIYDELANIVFEDIEDIETRFTVGVDSDNKLEISIDKKYLKEYLDEEVFTLYAGYKYRCYYILNLNNLRYRSAGEWVDDTLVNLISELILKEINE